MRYQASGSTINNLMLDRDTLDKHLQQLLVLLFHLLVFLTPLFFIWVNEELFEFNKMLLVYTLTTLIVATAVGKTILTHQLSWRKTPFDLPILLFLSSQLLSTFFSIHPYTSLFGYYTRFNGGLLSTLSYIAIFYLAVNFLEKKHLKSILISLLSSAILVSVWGTLEKFGSSFSCRLMIGRFSNDCWPESLDVANRVFASFGQPNWLAAFLTAVLPLSFIASLWIYVQLHKKIWKLSALILALATPLVIIGCTVFTKSDSGILAAAVAFLITLLLSTANIWRSEKLRQQISHRKWLKNIRVSIKFYLVSCALLLMMVTAITSKIWMPKLNTLADYLSGHLSSLTSQSNNQESLNLVPAALKSGSNSGRIRLIVWQGALAVWQRYPILGSGVETFAYSYYRDRPLDHNALSEWDFLYNKAHNEFLNYLATTGAVGLATYLLLCGSFIFVPLRYLFKKNSDKHQSRYDLLVTSAVISSQVAILITNFFGFSTVMVSILFFLVPAAWFVWISPSKNIHKFNSVKNIYVQLAASILILIVAVFFIVSIAHIWYADFLFASGKRANLDSQITLSMTLLQKAVIIRPFESTFYEELIDVQSQVAIDFYKKSDDVSALNYYNQAILNSKVLLYLNPVSLTSYKSIVKSLFTLSQMDDALLGNVQNVLEKAQTLAPTDPKIVYNQGITAYKQGDIGQAKEFLVNSIQLKSDFEPARMSLGAIYFEQNELTEATQQYVYVLEKIQPNNEQAKIKLLEIKKLQDEKGKK